MDAQPRQSWSPEAYAKGAGFVSSYGTDILGALSPKPGEHILDLGCGDGTLALEIERSGARVTGVDVSEAFVEAARAKGVTAHHACAHALPFESAFDAVFSNAALHWMLKPQAVIEGVKRALRPGGRFVGEFGGHGNVASIVTALNATADSHGIARSLANPWFFPTPERYRAMLEASGFKVEAIALIPRPTPLPGPLRDWLMIFRAPFFEAAGSRAADLLEHVETLLAPSLRDDEGRWTADYVRLRFIAHA